MGVTNRLAKKLEYTLFDSDSSFSLVDDVSVLNSTQCCEKINQYLDWLSQLDVQSVMIVSSPSIDALCLCYALVLSNKTYIPVHTSTSAELLHAYLQTYQVDLLLIQPQRTSQLSLHLKTKLIEEKSKGFFYYMPKQPETFCLLPGMILFTSGTSNQPKAVHYHYDTLMRYLSWCVNEFQLNEFDSFLFTTELSFVASLRPLFVPALAGARLCFPGSTISNKVQLMASALMRHRINILNLTPTLFKILIQYLENNAIQHCLLSIRLVFLSGEPLDCVITNYWLTHIKSDTLFYNLYGATEYLVPFYKKIDALLSEDERLHLGRLREGCDYQLLPDANNMGYELCIAGDIATAYFDEQQSRHNYILVKGRRFIKTQDFVTFERRELYFCSRTQRIIKKYGQLVNLDQIEYVLKKIHHALNFITFVDEKNENKIYLMIHGYLYDDALLKQIKSDLSAHLPGYMHPDEFIFTKNVPLTVSGKIDYLSAKEQLILNQHDQIMGYFQRFFPDKKVNRNTRIIDLGLESIDYIEMTDAFLNATGKWLDVARINEEIRIANISSCLVELHLEKKPNMNKVVGLNPIQAAFYAKELDRKGAAWACFVASFCLKGAIDVQRLEIAIAETLQNHFMLMSKLERIEDNYYFVTTSMQEKFIWRSLMLFPKSAFRQLKISIHADRLVNIYIQKRKGRYFLIMAYHHIALDGWSTALIREEIFRRYEGTYNIKPIKRADEINYLNQINLGSQNNSHNINELKVQLAGIKCSEYNQLDSFFDGALRKKHTSFSLGKSELEHFVHTHHLEGAPYSVIFALLLHQIIAHHSGVRKLFFYTSFSNRNLPIPKIKELVTNIATGLPVFLDSSNQTLKEFSEKIKAQFSAYFKNMSYGGLTEIWEKELIDRNILIVQGQPYFLLYTYINQVTDSEYIQDKYIDWNQSTNEIDDAQRGGFIYMRIYNMGSHFVVIFDSLIKKHLHERLLERFHANFIPLT